MPDIVAHWRARHYLPLIANTQVPENETITQQERLRGDGAPYELTAFSPADEISSAPVCFSRASALLISSDVSQCTDNSTPPSLTRPSYRLA
jgi:hypothetical protein